MPQKLSTTHVKVKVGNTSETLVNEIHEVTYS